MEHSFFSLPVQTDLARRVAPFDSLQQPAANRSSIWFFDSPKNDTRLTINTNLAFMHSVLLEGDVSVAGYDIHPPPRSFDSNGKEIQIKVDAIVYRHGGGVEWWNFRWNQKRSGKRKAHAAEHDPENVSECAAHKTGATYVVKTERDLLGKEILFDNWLTLCAAITRCRGHFLGREAEEFARRLSLQHSVTLGNLLAIPKIDVALMLAVVATSLQRGTTRTNLHSQLVGPMSLLSRVAS